MMKKKNKIGIAILIVVILIFVIGLIFIIRTNNAKKLLYCQEYTTDNGKQGELDITAFTDKSDKFEIGANAYGKAVFKDPDAALAELEKEYSEGIELIQKEYDLDDLSQKNYKQYEEYGWQIEGGTEKEKEQVAFVSLFLDVYANSFEK